MASLPSAVGSVVMPFNPPVPADVDYWYDNSVPHAGNIMAEYGHEVVECISSTVEY